MYFAVTYYAHRSTTNERDYVTVIQDHRLNLFLLNLSYKNFKINFYFQAPGQLRAWLSQFLQDLKFSNNGSLYLQRK